MGLLDWFKIKRVADGIKYRRDRIAYLEEQIKLCRGFSDFIGAAYKRGYKVEIFVSVDGQIAPSSIFIGRHRREILKYLAECSEGVRMLYHEQLESIAGPQ